MRINTDLLVSMTEANQNFSKVARLVDEKGSVLILKNNIPRYVLIDFKQLQQEQTVPDEDVEAISHRIMEQNLEVYQKLAK